MAKVMDSEKAFVTKLKALYDVEKELEKALPKMAKAAVNPDLKEGFTLHLEETRGHIARLEGIFEALGVKPGKEKSEGIRGIIEDGKWVMELEAPDNIRDGLLANAARHAEHYEMSGYLAAIDMAKLLGMKEAAAVLTETLNEEKETDKRLSQAAKENFKE